MDLIDIFKVEKRRQRECKKCGIAGCKYLNRDVCATICCICLAIPGCKDCSDRIRKKEKWKEHGEITIRKTGDKYEAFFPCLHQSCSIKEHELSIVKSEDRDYLLEIIKEWLS